MCRPGQHPVKSPLTPLHNRKERMTREVTTALSVARALPERQISNNTSALTQERGRTTALSVARALLRGEVSNYTSAFTQERGRTTALSVARASLLRDTPLHSHERALTMRFVKQ